VTNKLFKRTALLVALMMLGLVLAACGDNTATTAPAATTAAATTAAATTAAATTAAATTAAATTAAATTAAATTAAATTAAATTAAATTAAATTAAATTAASGGTLPKITGNLTIWHAYGSGGTGEPKALADALKLFQTDNPDAKLTVLDVPFDQIFNKLKTEAATGGGPDLFIVPNDSLGDLARANLLLPLDDKLKGKLENDSQLAIDGSKVDGKLYQVPESLKAVAMYYNKDKVKTVPKTTDEMMAAQKAGTKFGFNNNAYHSFGFTGGFGGKLLDASGKAVADTTGFIDAYQFFKDMKAAGAQFFSDGDKFDQAFQSGQLDAIVEGPWKLTDFQKALGDKLGVAAIPAGPKGPANPLTGVDGWNINVNTKNADNAVNFALYMTSPKIEQLFVDQAGHIPADKTIKLSDPYIQAFATAVATGYPRPQVAELSAYWDNFGNALSKIIDANGDPKTEVTNATAAMNKANKK
jgi:arabinogalactan oligomer/maltooligosaccharide transport system substrate-binding protein